MDELEKVMRWAWYYDYGTTPERSVERLKDSVAPGRHRTCDTSTAHTKMTLQDMLRKFSVEILAAGRKNNIDARAIAGAISWEYEENLRGRYSDYLQFSSKPLSKRGTMRFGEGLGWGSIHTPKAREIRPKANDWQLQCLRMQAASAIAMVAEIMDLAATHYYEASGGIWIRDAPAVLALFFNTSDEFRARSAEKQKLTSCEPGKVVTLTVTQNPMAKWVNTNLGRFSKFQTSPEAPTEWHARVDVN